MNDYIGSKDENGVVTWPRLALNDRPASASYTMRFLDAARFVLVPSGMAADLVEQKLVELAKAERSVVNGENLDGGGDTGDMDGDSAGQHPGKRKRGG